MMRNKYLFGNNKKQAGYPSGEKIKKIAFLFGDFKNYLHHCTP